MISPLDLDIYQALFQQKAITEKYIGRVEFEWLYSEVHYSAECTIGIPFDLFDKTITGILQVDDVLSIEEIGEILGMNVIHNPDKQQYKDEAEYEILRMALDSLKSYGMIETGDIYYSACRLTTIGREYAQKGRKFKIERNKTFLLYYDHTSQNHIDVKKVFQGIKGIAQPLRNDFDFLDEALMKQMAEKQETEVYNLEKGNSFTNASIANHKSHTYQVNLFIALLFDLKTRQFRLVAYEPNTKTINDSFSKWLDENHKSQILEQFQPQDQLERHLEVLPNEYLQTLEEKQTEFELLFTEKPEEALRIAKKANSELALVDLPYFWSNLGEFLSHDTQEFWFLLPEPSEKILLLIEKFTRSNPEIYVFLIISNQDIDEKIAQQITTLVEYSKQLFNKLFVTHGGIRTFDCFRFWKVNNEVTEFEEGKYTSQGSTFSYRALKRTHDSFSKNNYNIFKAFFAEEYLTHIKGQIEIAVNQELNSNEISKASILSFCKLNDKAHVFIDLKEYENILQQVYQIEQVKNPFVEKLKDQHKLMLMANLKELTDSYQKQEYSSLEPLKDYSGKIANIEMEFFEDYDELYRLIKEFKDGILQAEQRVKDEIMAKTFIVDTNVFIEEPDVISMIEKKHYVILSHTVIQELDRLKQKKQLKDKASKALSILNKQLGKNKRLKTARANLNLLSEDYRQNAPDNRILSVAYMYVEKNPVLLTNDNGLQLKAKSLQIPTISLKQFLGIGDAESGATATQVLPNMDFKVIYEHTPGKNGRKNIDDFYKTIKRIQPDFDFKDYGFKNLKLFLQSIPELDVYNNDFIKLKTQ